MTRENTEINTLENLKWFFHSEEIDISPFMESMPLIGGIANGKRAKVKTYMPEVEASGYRQQYEVCLIERQNGYKTVVALPRLEPIVCQHKYE